MLNLRQLHPASSVHGRNDCISSIQNASFSSSSSVTVTVVTRTNEELQSCVNLPAGILIIYVQLATQREEKCPNGSQLLMMRGSYASCMVGIFRTQKLVPMDVKAKWMYIMVYSQYFGLRFYNESPIDLVPSNQIVIIIRFVTLRGIFFTCTNK